MQIKTPKKTRTIKAKLNKWICPIGFKAITLFGTIYVRDKKTLESFNSGKDTVTINHEMIHVKQALYCKNSWFVFYLKYVLQWIINLPLLFINAKAPYKFIAFELEAYHRENDAEYQNKIIDGAFEWKKFDKLKLKEKWQLSQKYYEHRWKPAFRDFITSEIYPIVDNK